MRKFLAFALLALAGCSGGVKLRSPVAQAAKLQSPVEVTANEKAEACAPVYKPPVPHIDTGEDPCPGGVCRVPGAPDLPGHDQKPEKPTAQEGSGFGGSTAGLVSIVAALLLVTLVFIFKP